MATSNTTTMSDAGHVERRPCRTPVMSATATIDDPLSSTTILTRLL
eukprot:CAMPEP_0168286084 /NCGR_PEP_ID=MMETSP0142_2-20121227/666_1 /TAXON_ID=44445 /ORGANISM="Pseudo-nitzschia australis, Strain 10249 10 AB" /LENGTH=45 /DNA_ID= /DNA_START= /DNA_END= /DNA_ORIENTATION=